MTEETKVGLTLNAEQRRAFRVIMADANLEIAQDRVGNYKLTADMLLPLRNAAANLHAKNLNPTTKTGKKKKSDLYAMETCYSCQVIIEKIESLMGVFSVDESVDTVIEATDTTEADWGADTGAEVIPDYEENDDDNQ